MPTRGALTITEPVDGDDDNAATFDVPFRQLTDRVSQLSAHAAIVDDPNTFTAANTFDEPTTFNNLVTLASAVQSTRAVDTLPLFESTVHPTDIKLIDKLKVDSAGVWVRRYVISNAGQIETFNAWFNSGTGLWTKDEPAIDAVAWRIDRVLGVKWQTRSGAGTWADGAWQTRWGVDPAGVSTALTAPTITLQTALSETGAMPGTARAYGLAGADDLDDGWAVVRQVGGMVWAPVRHRNLIAFNNSVVGEYVLDFGTVLSDPDTAEVQATVEHNQETTGPDTVPHVAATCSDNGASKIRVTVHTHQLDLSGAGIAKANYNFSVRVRGR